MFLVRLNDKEKKSFFRLAQMAAEANGEVKYEESNYLECYKQEMSLGEEDLKDIEEITPDDILETFINAEDSHKRIVMFETIAFMYVDGTFDEAEQEFTYRFAEQIGLGKEKVDEIIGLVGEYAEHLTNIANVIL